MVVVVKKDHDQTQFDNLTKWLTSLGVKIHTSEGENSIVLGLVGDTSTVDIDLVRSLDIVEDVKRIQEPYKNANRKFHPQDSVIDVNGVKFGGGTFNIIAGPCSQCSAAAHLSRALRPTLFRVSVQTALNTF